MHSQKPKAEDCVADVISTKYHALSDKALSLAQVFSNHYAGHRSRD